MVALGIGAVEVVDIVEVEEVRYIFDSRPNKCILILAADVSSDLRLSVGLKILY